MIYYIFRHGATYESKKDIDYSGENVKTAPLLPEARPVTKGLAEYLKGISTDRNFTSPYLRCLQTAQIVTEVTGKKFEPDDRLGEYTFQLGESFDQMAMRLKDFYENLKKKDYKAVAICTHGAGISALKHYITTGKYEERDLSDYPEPGVLITINGKNIEYLDFNPKTH